MKVRRRLCLSCITIIAVTVFLVRVRISAFLVKGVSDHMSVTVCSIRQSDRPWRFKSEAVFERLDSFRARLHALQDMFQSAAAFGRLERIEIGGYQVRARSDCND